MNGNDRLGEVLRRKPSYFASFRLGIQISAGSLGWCALECEPGGEPVSVLDGGVRIYSAGRDPKTGAPLALARRDARGMRRRRDRYLRRRTVLHEELIRLGLLPLDEADRKNLELLDPYHIRAVALDERVAVHFLGRALFHLNQRRGFKSNLKADRMADDAELGVVASGIDNLDAAMAAVGARTYGEFLAHRRALDPDQHAAAARSTRVRKYARGGDYAFFPARRHLEAEFAALWQAQRQFHPAVLTDDAFARISRIMFFQREHRPPLVGACAYTGEARIPKAHPLFQRMRFFKAVNELTIEEVGKTPRALTKCEREKILCAFRSARSTKRRIAWSVVYKAAGLPLQARIKGAERDTSGLSGDEVEAEMVKLYGPEWRDLPPRRQWEIIERLRHEDDEAALLAFLQHELGLDEAHASALAKARLPAGYGRISEKAALRILAELEADVISEKAAVARCGWQHGADRLDQGRERLPYYGEVLEHHIPPGSHDPSDPPEECFGRILNPSVHIAFGQIRRIVNAIIDKYGRPREIIVEVNRDLKLSEKQRQEVKRIIKRSTEAGMRRGETLEALGVANTGANRSLLQMWEDLHPDPSARVCIYTGTPIGIEMLFSGETATDHILPIRATLDDSNANKLVVSAAAKREKGSRTPHSAFASTSEWDAILARAQSLSENKRWRFAPDALNRFGSATGHLEHNLSDNEYIARLVRTYLEALYPPTGESNQYVHVIRGSLTEALRRGWSLNDLLPDHEFAQTSKPRRRLDHRHHLISAFVVALSDARVLLDVASAAERNAQIDQSSVFQDLPEPWRGFRKQLKVLLERTIISHRPDHGTLATKADRAAGQDRTAGGLHNDTAYGLTNKIDAKGNEIVVRRVPLMSLDSDEKIATVRDNRLQTELAIAVRGTSGKARQEALERFAREHPVYRDIRRVRVIEPARTVKIHDRSGRAYKGHKGNSIHRIDIWRLPCGEWVSNWVDENGQAVSSAVQMFDAHRACKDGSQLRPHPAAKKVLSLQQNDLIALEHPLYGECICRVVKLRETGQVTLAPHKEAGDLIQRNKLEGDPFKYYSPSASGLKKARARQIRIDPLGRVWDPGPREPSVPSQPQQEQTRAAVETLRITSGELLSA